jgi:hypothetical protein
LYSVPEDAPEAVGVYGAYWELELETRLKSARTATENSLIITRYFRARFANLACSPFRVRRRVLYMWFYA